MGFSATTSDGLERRNQPPPRKPGTRSGADAHQQPWPEHGGAGGNGQQGDRNTSAFMVLTGLNQKVEQAKASVLCATTLAQRGRERDALQQPIPMVFI